MKQFLAILILFFAVFVGTQALADRYLVPVAGQQTRAYLAGMVEGARVCAEVNCESFTVEVAQ